MVYSNHILQGALVCNEHSEETGDLGYIHNLKWKLYKKRVRHLGLVWWSGKLESWMEIENKHM